MHRAMRWSARSPTASVLCGAPIHYPDFMFQYREAANFPWRSQAPQEAASPARFSSPYRLQAAGFPVFICPCITTACAAAASAGILLSLRGVERAVGFVTAHSRRSAALDLDWRSLARGGSKLAFYMGRDAAGEIMRNLIAAGMPGGMPVLIACDVSRSEENRLSTRLDLLDLQRAPLRLTPRH